MAIPSIAMIPSGYKANKLYSVLPTNGDGDFTTTRNTVATRVNENGLIEEVAVNVPRLDYSDGACPSLLLEPLSRNLIQYSEAFDNAYWTKTGATVTGGFVSPSGDTNAFKLVESASNGEHFVKHTGLTVADDKYSFTLFAKAGGNSKLRVRGENYFPNVTGADFDLTAKTATNLSSGENAKIVEMSNGWFKCTFTSLTNGYVGASGHFGIYLLDDNGDVSWLGDGTNGVYIYGAQFEQQSYATSYIKNEGTANGITRAADTCGDAGTASTFNDSEGVLYYEGNLPVADVNFKEIQINSGSNANMVRIQFRGNGNIRFYLFLNNSQTFLISETGIDYSTPLKVAVVYKSGASKLYINGTQRGSTNTDTYTFSSSLSTLTFDGIGAGDFYGKVKDLRVYTTALEGSELETLTTI